MNLEPGFIEVRYLFLSPLLIAVFCLFVFFRRRARTSACALLRLPPPRGTRGYGLVLVVALLAISLARPYTGFRDHTVPTRGRDIAVLFDISQSMLAHDESPTRLAFAARKLEDLISAVQSETPGDRIALILFAGESYLFSPLTADYAVLRHFARAISPELITRGGSRIDRAIAVALESLQSADATSGALLILSDGEDARDSTPQLIARLTSANVPLFALGVGTSEGTPIEYEPRRFIKDPQGAIVVSKLNDTTLRALAEGSGGAYMHARNGDTDIKAILQHLSTVEENQGRSGTVRQHDEVGAYLVILALLVLAMSAAIQPAWILLSVALVLSPRLAIADAPEEEAYQAYQAGQFDDAVAKFSALAKQHPDDRKTQQALASSQFKAGNFDAAAELFQRLAESAASGRERFESLYNLGNAELARRQLAPAVDAYTEALRIKPGDTQAEHNLGIAKRLLLEPTPTPTPQPSPQPTPSSSPSAQPSAGASPQNQDAADQKSSGDQQQPQEGETKDEQTPSDPSSTEKQDAAGEQKSPGSEEPAPTSTSPEPQRDAADTRPTTEKEDLSERAARAWLESLPEAPLLLRRKNSQEDTVEGQTW